MQDTGIGAGQLVVEADLPCGKVINQNLSILCLYQQAAVFQNEVHRQNGTAGQLQGKCADLASGFQLEQPHLVLLICQSDLLFLAGKGQSIGVGQIKCFRKADPAGFGVVQGKGIRRDILPVGIAAG